jgi:SAM-dependent methyltransferase
MFHPDGPTFFELARQALSSTERGYDLLAPKFDVTPFRTPDVIIRATLAEVGTVDDAVDLCCGTGAGLAALHPSCRRRLVGVDTSRGMLAEAERRLEGREAPPHLELVRADVLDLPFADSFDLATCFGAFGHILPADEPRFVRAIHRALRDGGRFVFATAERPAGWSLERLLAEGFNAAMRLRNALWHPPFIMYYLTFLLPDCRLELERAGFDVAVRASGLEPPLDRLRIVTATRRAASSTT